LLLSRLSFYIIKNMEQKPDDALPSKKQLLKRSVKATEREKGRGTKKETAILSPSFPKKAEDFSSNLEEFLLYYYTGYNAEKKESCIDNPMFQDRIKEAQDDSGWTNLARGYTHGPVYEAAREEAFIVTKWETTFIRREQGLPDPGGKDLSLKTKANDAANKVMLHISGQITKFADGDLLLEDKLEKILREHKDALFMLDTVDDDVTSWWVYSVSAAGVRLFVKDISRAIRLHYMKDLKKEKEDKENISSGQEDIFPDEE
jgi:hypothetical protein